MKHTRNFICTAVLFALFMALTLCVLFVDVQAIGPKDSEIGLATINGRVFDCFGESTVWYAITELLGYVAIFTAMIFVGMAGGQLFKRKSLRKVDPSLLALIGMYVLMAGCYVLFEIVVINYRPVLEENALAASYPSSHTMLVCCIMLSTMLEVDLLTDSKAWRTGITIGAFAIVVLTVVGRLLSGVHWFTDILGAVLLASTLVMLYYYVAQKSIEN